MKIIFNKIKEKIQKKDIVIVLGIALILRIIYLSANLPLWWDGHVYVGMGKYIFSNGSVGLWESFRPLVHPLLLGFAWSKGISPVIFGKIADLAFSVGAVALVYAIGTRVFSKRVGFIASLIFSVTPVFFIFTGLVLTEPLAIFLGLLSIYFFVKSTPNYFLAGLFGGLSFLTKFPQGIYFGVIFIVLLFVRNLKNQHSPNETNKIILTTIKKIIFLTAGFIITVAPYFIFNYYRYPNPLEPFISASWIVTTSTHLYGSGLFYYFTHFFFQQPIYLFYFGYIYLLFKYKHWKDWRKLVIFLIPTLTLVYFQTVPRKEVRYMVGAVPFFTILIAFALVHLYEYIKKHPKPLIRPKAFIILIAILVISYIPTTINFEFSPDFTQEVKQIIKENNITGPILSSDPAFVSFVENNLILFSGAEYASVIYNVSKGKYELMFVDSCDFACEINDNVCTARIEKLHQDIKKENNEVYSKTYTYKKRKCTYKIYLPKVNEK